MALFVLQPPSGGLFMKYTRTRDEVSYGLEYCCDSCGEKAGGHHPRLISNHWWYVRYNANDEYPSMWICDKCKGDME